MRYIVVERIGDQLFPLPGVHTEKAAFLKVGELTVADDLDRFYEVHPLPECPNKPEGTHR